MEKSKDLVHTQFDQAPRHCSQVPKLPESTGDAAAHQSDSNRDVVPLHSLIQVMLDPGQSLPPSQPTYSDPAARRCARTITHGGGVLQGPQTLMKRFPQKSTINQRPIRLITT